MFSKLYYVQDMSNVSYDSVASSLIYAMVCTRPYVA